MPAADFTSSLYLDMRHPSSELPAWTALTSGRPAALDPPVGAAAAGRLAALGGAQRAVLARSTLHALNDCLDVLSGPGTALAVDAGVYPVGRWAVQRAAGAGMPVSSVAHHDVADLLSSLRRITDQGHRPVVVADGLCTGCGRAYPIGAVLPVLDGCGATLLLDDTQALGILGARGRGAGPYGRGGGGSVAHAGVPHASIVAVASLAKAFGAPVAFVAGSAPVINRLRCTGSALHSSPPSAADVAAANRAVDRNAVVGDRLREVLLDRVRAFREHAAIHGLTLVGGLLPVQSTPGVSADVGRWLLRRLAADGVRAVLRRTCEGTSAVTLVITASHGWGDIELAAAVLSSRWRELRPAVRDAL